jgi:HAD superfamily hydrolase (TIGR01509 family)
MNIQAIIFDMDGVLIDSEPLHHAAMNAVLAPLNHTVEDPEYRTYIGASSAYAWERIVAARRLPDPPATYMARYDEAVCAVVAEQGVPMPGLLPLLADLRAAGVPLAVASSSAARWVEVTLGCIGVRDDFAVVVSGEQVTRGKPAPDIFLRAAALLGVDPAHCLVIEDSPRGLEAARAAGMFAVALQAAPLPPGAPPPAADLVVASLPEFHAWWRASRQRSAVSRQETGDESGQA